MLHLTLVWAVIALFGRKQGHKGRLPDAANLGIDTVGDHVNKETGELKTQVAELQKEIESLKKEAEAMTGSKLLQDSTIADLKNQLAKAKSGGISKKTNKLEYYHNKIAVSAGQKMPFIGDHYPRIDEHLSMDVIGTDSKIEGGDFHSCQEVDVIFRRSSTEHKRCLALVEAGHWATEGWMLSYKVDPKTLLVGKTLAEGRTDRRYSKFHGSFTAKRDALLVPFLAARIELINKVKKLLKGPEGSTCLVMCANEGHVALILNFVCNLRIKAMKLPQHVFFVTSKHLAEKMTKWGLTAFYDKVFDKLPTKDAGAYGDGTFAEMMMLKQFSATLVLEAGYDVLFQDADMVWEKDPIPELRKNANEYKTQWMDDGSRDPRFAPFFVNSGFFYLQHHFSVLQFWDHALMSSSFALDWRSNQEMINWLLEEHHTRFTLSVLLLPPYEYVSGKYLGQGPKWYKQHQKDVQVLHFCWTTNKKEKQERLKSHSMFAISDECYNSFKECKGKTLDDICK